MLSLRALAAVIVLALVNLQLVTCRSPGDGGKNPAPSSEPGQAVTEPIELPGMDTTSLTAREKTDWSAYVSELLSPCPDQPVTLAECVKQKRDCKLCLPAAKFLAKQVREGKARSQVESAFRKRFGPDQIRSIELGDSPSLGPASAPVVIVEWADFECPFCGKAAPILHDLVQAYPGQVRIIFKHYPLSVHKYADKAARAAVAAQRQDKFWEMHERLFGTHAAGKDLEESSIKRIAAELRLDTKKFEEDWASEATADVVARDRKQADSLQLSGTPWIYVNGRHFDFTIFDLTRDLDEWIELEIESKTGKRMTRSRALDAGTPEPAVSGRASGVASSPRAPSGKHP